MNSTDPEIAVRAAGGVILRGASQADARVVLVHRPRYDDWTLPKGKHEVGEGDLDCAVREVREETGYLCRVPGPAGTSRYRVAVGLKEVRYYLMRPIRFNGFEPNEEVDEVRWIEVDAAQGLLTYPFDRRLLAGIDLAAALAPSELHIVRHGAAGDRSDWEGPDIERPLTPRGEAQAKNLAEEMAGLGVERILSSPYLRCVQTVDPLAERLGLPLERTDALAEGADPQVVAQLLDEVAGSMAVVCSHGDIVPLMLEQLQRRGISLPAKRESRKGSTWVIGHDGRAYTDATYLPPTD